MPCVALIGQIHIPTALPPWKNPRYQLNMGPNGSNTRSGRFEKEEIILPFFGGIIPVV
jgi:hypothetical protein